VDHAHKLNEANFKTTYGMSFNEFAMFCYHYSLAKGIRDEKKELFDGLSSPARELVKSLIRHGVILQDISRKNQWGDLKDKPVLVDYGFNNQVKRDHYSVVMAFLNEVI